MEEGPNEISEKEFRAAQAEKIIDFLTRIGAYEYIQKLISNPEADQSLSFDKFKDFLTRLNGIARDIPISERKTDGETVYLSGFDEALVPRQEDKEAILKDAYEAMSKISSGDEAYLLPATVNAVHLFADGNGRTSRVLHTLLTKFESNEKFIEKLRLALSEDGRYETADINPARVRTDIDKIILNRHGIKFENEKEWSPIFPNGFRRLFASTEEVENPKAKEFMSLRRTDQSYCFISAYEYLKEKDLISKNVIELRGGVALSPSKMDQLLSEADWEEILNKYYELKKEHVEILIDAFVKPEEYKNLDGSMNLRDYFLSEIHKRLQKNESQS